ncbi:probable (S)-ureidoglycine aminohydrolase isoform X2 [Miscanthus floridulus]|uniref:probable (S)-ureidoglycine aminohydrolase isoform X2 n=1 Tax=Miscanthus floridulus TaxID=154761 RepID=UPI00345A5A92
MRDCKYSNSVAFINLYSRALNIFMILIIFGTCSLYTHPLCISSADSALMWLTKQVQVDSYAYLPANTKHSMISDEPTTVVIFERRYSAIEDSHPDLIVGSTDKQPLLETLGEVFQLRKLLPTSLSYDFNIHIMDFQPGEYLNVKVSRASRGYHLDGTVCSSVVCCPW